MSTEFAARRLDVKKFAASAGSLDGRETLGEHERLMAETQRLGADRAVVWSVSGELRNPEHVQPEIWLHLQARATLPLICQRCLGPVDIDLTVQRSFRFVSDEEMAAAQDEQSEEDVLAVSRSFDLVELVEDELLMQLPLAPRHEVCPTPVKLAVSDEQFDRASAERENPFAVLGKLKTPKN
jgi:uncharacterized protein